VVLLVRLAPARQTASVHAVPLHAGGQAAQLVANWKILFYGLDKVLEVKKERN